MSIDELGHASATEVSGNINYQYTYAGTFDREDESLWDSLPAEYARVEVKNAWNGTIITSWDEGGSPYSIKTECDMLGRKYQYIDPDMGTWSYAYDNINNILEKDGDSYTYAGPRPHAVTGDGVYTYTNDANGNMVGRLEAGVPNRTIAYDYENRVSSISDGGTPHAFPAAGRRLA